MHTQCRAFAVVAVLIATLIAGPAASAPLFSAPFLAFDTGASPEGFAIADFNADGVQDIAVATRYAVLLYEGVGDGTFVYRSGVGGVAPIAAADVDGDGRVDLVAAGPSGRGPDVRLGRGDFTFQFLGGHGGPYGVGRLALEDFDQEGRPDLLTVARDLPFLSVSLNSGHGEFRGVTGLDMVSSALVLGDLNGDGKLDIAMPGGAGVVTLMGLGTGAFATRVEWTVSTPPSRVAIGDVNGDGYSDVVIWGPAVAPVGFLPGRGDGTFGTEQPLGISRFYGELAIADVNGDGRMDIVVTNRMTNRLTTNLQIASGTFDAGRDSDAGPGPNGLAMADVNGDGRIDAVVSDMHSNSVAVLLGQANGQLGSVGVPVDLPRDVTLADLNRDGHLDLLTACDSTGRLSVRRGNGNGTFGAPTEYAVGIGVSSVVAGNFDGDGVLDLAMAGDDSVVTQHGRVDGTFDDPVRFAAPSPSRVIAGDLDRDGAPDLVACSQGTNSVTVLRGRGDGAFTSLGCFATGASPAEPVLADWNGDGNPDLAVVNQASNSVSLLLGRGDGGFEPARNIIVGPGPWDIAAADADHDGRVDLMVALTGDSGTPPKIVFLRGQGDGSFAPGVAFGVGDHTRMLAVADFDNDGSIDIAATSPFTQTVSVYRGAGNGTFGTKQDFGTGPYACRLAVGDLNGDGRADLAVATLYPGAVTLLLNTSVDYPTAVALSFIDATWTAEGVTLRWTSISSTGVAIERSDTPVGPWVQIAADVTCFGGILRAVDRTVDRAQSHYYRIVATATSDAVLVESAPTAALALSIAPNPARRKATITYTLPRAARVRLTVADVQGRVIARPVDEPQSAGAHAVAFEVRAYARAGVAFVRLEAEGRQVTRRVVLAP